MTTERRRQEQLAFATQERVYRFHFIAVDHTASYSAIAPTESGAFRVVNAECPGVRVSYTDRTEVPAPPLELRNDHRSMWAFVNRAVMS